MAALYPAHSPMGYSDATWSLADDDAQNHVKPGAGDTPTFTVNSGPVTMEEDTAALGGWNMAGYTQLLNSNGAWTIDVDGNLTLGGQCVPTDGHTLLFEVTGNIEVAAGTTFNTAVSLTHNEIAANARTIQTRGLCENVAFTINNPGITSLTASEDGGTTILWKSFEIKANAKYAGGAFDHEIGGNLIITTGVSVFTQTGLWKQTASGNISNPNTSKPFANLFVGDTGVTSTMTANVMVKKVQYGAGTVTGAFTFGIYPAVTSDNFFTSGSGTFSPTKLHMYIVSVSNGQVKCDCDLHFVINHGGTLTMTGDIDCGSNGLQIEAAVAGLCTVDMNNHSLTAGAVRLGRTAHADRSAELLLRGATHSIASLQAERVDDATNKVDFGSCHLNLSGTMLGERNAGVKITFTNTLAEIHGGTITKCDLSGTNALYAYGSTDGLGNANVLFDPTPPNSLMLLGVGRG